MPRTPPPPREFVPLALNVRASGVNDARLPAEPLPPVLQNAAENPENTWSND